MYRSRTTIVLLTAAILLTPALAPAADSTDWPQFRGARRDGVSIETGLLKTWPEKGPREVWRRDLGEGYSAISVVGDRLYTMYAGQVDEEAVEFAAAFDAATGKEIWRTRIGKKYDNEFGNGPRATPTVDGDTVFVLGSVGDLAALDIVSGSERWRLNLTEAFGSKVPTFGFSTSPLVDAGQVILEGGGAEGKSYAGLDRKTGAVRWTSGDGGREPGYNSPLAVDLGGQRRYIYVVGTQLRCIDGQGKEIWSRAWPEGETHAMPIFIPPDRLFASGAEGVGAEMLRLKGSGQEPAVEEIWKTPYMRNHFSSSVVHGNHIYGFDNASFKCISTADAAPAWTKRGFGKGSLILADGNLMVLSDQGRLTLVQASPDAYVEKGSIQALQGRSWTAPTLSGGRLYLRNHTEMVVYDLAS